ncbi:hypothetical protein JTE90_005386 [Oedothorax gibbosus]|uniref:Uncharacterized protein n=1 Tax=Oedothorax gibbosus TaxID=931172 RepID=A0AAV6V887_9ARAC|nr:hypothetical protein JTE90_005386 [Oedothorax gibbosus]
MTEQDPDEGSYRIELQRKEENNKTKATASQDNSSFSTGEVLEIEAPFPRLVKESEIFSSELTDFQKKLLCQASVDPKSFLDKGFTREVSGSKDVCILCGDFGKDKELWYRCCSCSEWIHSACNAAESADNHI